MPADRSTCCCWNRTFRHLRCHRPCASTHCACSNLDALTCADATHSASSSTAIVPFILLLSPAPVVVCCWMKMLGVSQQLTCDCSAYWAARHRVRLSAQPEGSEGFRGWDLKVTSTRGTLFTDNYSNKDFELIYRPFFVVLAAGWLVERRESWVIDFRRHTRQAQANLVLLGN